MWGRSIFMKRAISLFVSAWLLVSMFFAFGSPAQATTPGIGIVFGNPLLPCGLSTPRGHTVPRSWIKLCGRDHIWVFLLNNFQKIGVTIHEESIDPTVVSFCVASALRLCGSYKIQCQRSYTPTYETAIPDARTKFQCADTYRVDTVAHKACKLRPRAYVWRRVE